MTRPKKNKVKLTADEAKVNWQFTTKDAHIKLVSLYPDIYSE